MPGKGKERVQVRVEEPVRDLDTVEVDMDDVFPTVWQMSPTSTSPQRFVPGPHQAPPPVQFTGYEVVDEVL